MGASFPWRQRLKMMQEVLARKKKELVAWWYVFQSLSRSCVLEHHWFFFSGPILNELWWIFTESQRLTYAILECKGRLSSSTLSLCLQYNGTAHMATSSFIQKDCSVLEYISSDCTQCLSWCTPVLFANDYVYSFLLNQLQREVWICLLASVTIVLLGISLLIKVSIENWSPREAFNLALLIYAQPPPTKPRGYPARLVVGIWLCVCLVLRAAYEGEMKV